MRRASMPPGLYPLGLLLALVLVYLVRSGVSPYAAVRPLLVATLLGLGVPWLLGLLTGDRHRAALLAIALVAAIVVGQSLATVALWAGLVVITTMLGVVGVPWQTRIRWPVITRVMNAATAIILVAIGITAVQEGRITRIAADVVSEGPFPRAEATSPGDPGRPSVYLLLLDGYPRADKLRAEFGIDNTPFVGALRDRSFVVADHSRSNQVLTDATLASMFNGDIPGNPDPGVAGYRSLINHGRILQIFRDLDYEIISFSSGSEGVALRAADRYLDSGHLNELEWKLLRLLGLSPILDAVWPTLLADGLRGRVVATLEAIPVIAREVGGRPRLVFAHLLSPHSPLIFGSHGDPVPATGLGLDFTDGGEYTRLGREEYSRHLEGQVTYLNRRVLEAVDTIVEADPTAVVVVFSDHGSGIRDGPNHGGSTDVDLRTANLLAVRSPGRTGLIEDRSTLVNLLPRILRAYVGSGPADVPETIYGRTDDGQPVVFERPD